MSDWIRTDESLPEEGTDVLIFQNFRPPYITIGRIAPNKPCHYWEWIEYPTDWGHYSPTSFTSICPGNQYVKAWMPLPEPLKLVEFGQFKIRRMHNGNVETLPVLRMQHEDRQGNIS